MALYCILTGDIMHPNPLTLEFQLGMMLKNTLLFPLSASRLLHLVVRSPSPVALAMVHKSTVISKGSPAAPVAQQ